METIIGKTFDSERIAVADGTRFIGCVFCNCTLSPCGKNVVIERCYITGRRDQINRVKLLANKLISHLLN